MPEYEIEYRIKNLYDQKPTEEECMLSAIAMAKAQLSLGISPEESIRILEKLEPQALIPDPGPFLQPMIPMIQTIPMAVEPIMQPVMDEVLPTLTDIFNPPSRTNVVMKSSLKKIGMFFVDTIRSIYSDE